jgi:hypothetical protein
MFRSAHPALAAGLLLVASAAAADERIFPPFDLYETAPLSDASLAGLQLGGFEVLHQERAQGATWVLSPSPTAVSLRTSAACARAISGT